jgi:predicted PurR-regulated permease PerM
MNVMDPKQKKIHEGFVVLLTIVLLIGFLLLIRDFFMTVVLAALFSGLLFPFQEKLEKILKGRRGIASVVVLGVAFFIVVIPLLGVVVIAAREFVQISENFRPWWQQQMDKPAEQWLGYLQGLPFFNEVKQFESNIIDGLSNLLQTVGNYVMPILSSATTETLNFILKVFVGVYAAFIFLNTGDRVYKTVTGYLPLTQDESCLIVKNLLIVVRAVLKSLLVIGAVQGVLVSLAFWVLGLQGAVFWGIVVAVLSAIPGVGASLVWFPAVIYLIVTERLWAGVGLALWGSVIVGLSDNYLRPMIIGQDANIPELVIFLSILGGLVVFGLPGFILGPLVASLFVSVLAIYEDVFRRVLKQ